MTSPSNEEIAKEIAHARGEANDGNTEIAASEYILTLCDMLEALAAEREWKPIETADKRTCIIVPSKTDWPILAHWYAYNGAAAWRDSDGLQVDATHFIEVRLPSPPKETSGDVAVPPKCPLPQGHSSSRREGRRMSAGQFKIEWLDSGLESKCQPDPAYPNGIDVDCSGGAKRACKASLPYPAQRGGAYIVECEICGYRAAITTAGRRDDPRSVTIPCKIGGKVQ